MASSKLYDLVVHFNSNIRVIGNVDSNRYSFLELINDIFKATVDDSNIGMGMSITIQDQHPKSLELFELKSDDDVMHLFHMHESENEIHLYLDIIPAVPLSTMFKSVSKEDRENARKSNVEASSSTPHIIMEESNNEPKTDNDEEEQYDFTTDDVEWVGESDDDHSDDFFDFMTMLMLMIWWCLIVVMIYLILTVMLKQEIIKVLILIKRVGQLIGLWKEYHILLVWMEK